MSPLNGAPRSLLTKLLHVMLLSCILWQLTVVQLVELPTETQPGNTFYVIHQWVGLTTLAVVVLFWVWSLIRRAETPFAALFPWCSLHRLIALKADVKLHFAALRRYQLPAPGEATPLASAVHGLGLATALAMGVTGAWLYTMTVPDGVVLEVHKAISNLMWAYVILHAGLGVLHQFGGRRVLQRMFSFVRNPRS